MKNFGLKTNKLHRIIAATICVVMLLGLVFQVTLFSAPEGEEPKPEQAVTRVADASTINSWKEFYGTEKNTSNIGKIWTDKTVSTGELELIESDLDMIPEQDNFMVGLSALSSSKSVTLEAAIPVDVMFALDVSSSMKETGGVKRISRLIQAVNESIETILDMNEKNRIGVVLYTGGAGGASSSTQHAYCILPLDRYKAAEENQYLAVEYAPNGGIGQNIKVEKGVVNSENQPMDMTEKFPVDGNTYIQNGLLRAFEEFIPEPTENTDGSIPVIALMGDGYPTAASTQYADGGKADIEDLNDATYSTDLRIAFLTQLTAAWVKKSLEEYYSKSPLFYTVGLFDEEAEKDSPYASMVFDPSGENSTNEELDYLWNEFLNADPETSVHLEAEGKSMDVFKKDSKLSEEKERYYVDGYFNASNAKELDVKFKELVERIKIQSAEFPTEEEENAPNYSGYLMFEDPIGEYMHVEHMKGVMYNGELHQGNTFAKKMEKDGEATEEEGTAFLDSLVERLKITEAQAKELWSNAQEQGQISYDESQVNNYIAWYAKEDGTYLAPCNSEEELPEGAAYLNKSYFYYGNSSGTASGEKMMYLGVRIEKNLTSDMEKVKFSIPAALIPLVKYEISRNAANAKDSHTKKKEAFPMHLFYEVGLNDDINEYDLSGVEPDYKYLEDSSDSKKMASFYSNAWIDDGEKKEAQTSVQFYASDNNEYYYYTEETLIYVKDQENGNKIYTGKMPSADDGNEYYYKKWIYNLNGGAEEKLFPIAKESLNVQQATGGNGGWVILPGTFRYERLEEKSKNNENNLHANATKTADYIYKSSIQTNASVYENIDNGLLITLLGNNGKSIIQQGKLIITNAVDGFFGQDNEETEFHFELSLKPVDKERVPSSIKGTKNTVEEIFQIQDGKIEFTLTDDGKIEFWLPAGIDISLLENGDNEEHYGTTITVEQGEQIFPEIEGKEVKNLEIITQSISRIDVLNGYEPPDPLVILYTTDENGKRIGGAEFNLYKLNCLDSEHTEEVHNKIIHGEEDEGCWKKISSAVSDDYSGYLKFLNEIGEPVLATEGTYRLVEVRAPEGYMRSIGQWNMKVQPGEQDRIAFEEIQGEKGERPTAIKPYADTEFLIPHYKPVAPPLTGGRGIDRFLILGAIVAASGLMITVHLVLQRKRGKL